MKPIVASGIAGLLLATPALAHPTQDLKVGDPAPALHIAEWVKGDAVDTLEEGSVYMVEFWATWCGPCIRGMPHLSELQKEYGDQGFQIIAVSSEDARGNNLDTVRDMVEQKGDVMSYTIAFDEGRKTNDAWMRAANQRGIPASFLVDKQGNIAWIGHPMLADIPIAMILDDSWDYEEGPKLMEEIQGKQQEIYEKGASEPAAALDMIDTLYEKHPALEGSMEQLRFQLLLMLPDRSKDAAKVGNALVDEAIESESAMDLNMIAWMLVDPAQDREERHLDLAQRAAEKANAISKQKDPAILDTLARVHAWKGNYEKALEIQQKAVANAEGQMKAQLEEALDEYRKHLGKNDDDASDSDK